MLSAVSHSLDSLRLHTVSFGRKTTENVDLGRGAGLGVGWASTNTNIYIYMRMYAYMPTYIHPVLIHTSTCIRIDTKQINYVYVYVYVPLHTYAHVYM